ncbi:MAG: flavodoxin family protein [Candidatus Micrarchaeota archaeon]
MKLLIINGSHIGDGCTAELVETARAEAEKLGAKAEVVQLAGKEVKFCLECGACRSGKCVLKDDVEEILEEMKGADAIIVGSPVFFGGVSGKLKTLFDRTFPLRRGGFALNGKIGAAIAVGGSRNGGQEGVVSQMHAWMLIHGMVVAGDAPPTAHFGGIVNARSPPVDDEVGVETVKNTVKQVIQTLKRMNK